MSEESSRLSRIETKLDQLTEVVVALAKHDERINAHSSRLNRVEERLDDVEDSVNKNTMIAGAGKWLACSVVATAVAILVKAALV